MSQRKPLHLFLFGTLLAVFQWTVYLGLFEVMRSSLWTVVFSNPDADRALYWQYYTLLFAVLTLVANIWIQLKGLSHTPSRRAGIWLAVLIVLFYFSMIHLEPRPEAVAVTTIPTGVAILLRELVGRVRRGRSK